jgi:hypothetical protein
VLPGGHHAVDRQQGRLLRQRALGELPRELKKELI